MEYNIRRMIEKFDDESRIAPSTLCKQFSFIYLESSPSSPPSKRFTLTTYMLSTYAGSIHYIQWTLMKRIKTRSLMNSSKITKAISKMHWIYPRKRRNYFRKEIKARKKGTQKMSWSFKGWWRGRKLMWMQRKSKIWKSQE